MSETAMPIRPEGHLALTRIAGGDAETWALVSGVAAYLARLEKADGITGAHVEAAARIAAGNELGDALDDDDNDDEAQADVPAQASAPEVRLVPASVTPLPVTASAPPAAPDLPSPAARVPLGRNSARPPRATARRSTLLLPLLGGCIAMLTVYLGMAGGSTRLVSSSPANTPPLAPNTVPAAPALPANSASVSPAAIPPTSVPIPATPGPQASAPPRLVAPSPNPAPTVAALPLPPLPAAVVPAPAPAAAAPSAAATADVSAAPPRRRLAPPRVARTGPVIEETELPPPRPSADTYDALQNLLRRYSATGDAQPEAKQDPRSDVRADARPEPRPEPRAEALRRRAPPAGESPTRYIGSFVMGADGVRVFVPRP